MTVSFHSRDLRVPFNGLPFKDSSKGCYRFWGGVKEHPFFATIDPEYGGLNEAP